MSSTAARTPASDHAEIRDLVERYAAAVDDRRFAEVATLFTDDAVLVSPAPPASLGPTVAHEGSAAIADAMAALRHFTATVHAVHGVVVDLDDDEATGRVSCTAHHLSAGAEKHHDLVWELVYRDRYRHTERGWRFSGRELRIVSITTTQPRAVGPMTGQDTAARPVTP